MKIAFYVTVLLVFFFYGKWGQQRGLSLLETILPILLGSGLVLGALGVWLN